MDGTILNSDLAITHSVNDIRQTLNLPALSKTQIISYITDANCDFYAQVYENKLKACDDWAFKKNYLLHANLFEGIKKLLFWCKDQGFFMGLATNSSGDLVKHTLQNLQVYDCFDEVFCAGDGYEYKPSPQMLSLILEKSPFDKSLFIGDSKKDELAANCLDIPCILMGWQSSKCELLSEFSKTLEASNAAHLKRLINLYLNKNNL